jgi:hypothetical protein
VILQCYPREAGVFLDASSNIAEGLRLPADGYLIPPGARMLREKVDKNRDGRVTNEELDALSVPTRRQVDKFLQRCIADDPAFQPEKRLPSAKKQATPPGEEKKSSAPPEAKKSSDG